VTGFRPGRMRVVSRPGLDRFAGPSARDLLVARWIPVIVPLVLYALHRVGLRFPDLFYLLTAIALLLSARTWMRIGSGLGILVLVQLLAGGIATLLLVGNSFEPASWFIYSAATALMMGYVAWFFNVLGSLLPR
jgi:hypothetical protein